VARTPERIRQEEEINRRGRLGVPLQPTGRAGLPARRGVRWWRQRDARLGLGQLPQGPRHLLPRGPTVTAPTLRVKHPRQPVPCRWPAAGRAPLCQAGADVSNM
jgi:hypothetical protein